MREITQGNNSAAQRSRRVGKRQRGVERSPFAAFALMLGGVALMAVVALVPSTAGATDVGPGSSAEVANTPYSSSSGECDEGRDGWHIIMNGITTSDDFPPTADDFGPVNLVFSDASTAQALFTDMTGPVAHFLNNTVNQEDSFTITSAAMTFPSDTRITSYNQFRISHPPCGTIVTTTTTSPVSTETTTTVPESTTTTSPVSTETTTTVPESTTTTSPVVTLPTTMVPPDMPGGLSVVTPAFVERQVQAARIAQTGSGSNLPSTGIDGRPFAVTGLLLLVAGGSLWVITRRKAMS